MPEPDTKLTAGREPDLVDAYLTEVKQRCEAMSQPGDDRDLYAFAADTARKVGTLPGAVVRRGGVGMDVWTDSPRGSGSPQFRVWVERGENGHLSAYGGNEFKAARSDLPRLLEAVRAALAGHPCTEETVFAACSRHNILATGGDPDRFAAMRACPDCVKEPYLACGTCERDWPCEPHQDIAKALLGGTGA